MTTINKDRPAGRPGWSLEIIERPVFTEGPNHDWRPVSGGALEAPLAEDELDRFPTVRVGKFGEEGTCVLLPEMEHRLTLADEGELLRKSLIFILMKSDAFRHRPTMGYIPHRSINGGVWQVYPARPSPRPEKGKKKKKKLGSLSARKRVSRNVLTFPDNNFVKSGMFAILASSPANTPRHSEARAERAGKSRDRARDPCPRSRVEIPRIEGRRSQRPR